MSCPFCGLDPFEYADVGIGGRGVPVAVNCCELGPSLYEHYADEKTRVIAAKVVDELGDMPDGEARYLKAIELFNKYEAQP